MEPAVDIVDGLIYSCVGGHPRYADLYVPQDHTGSLPVTCGSMAAAGS
jgi:hypothetical protein